MRMMLLYMSLRMSRSHLLMLSWTSPAPADKGHYGRLDLHAAICRVYLGATRCHAGHTWQALELRAIVSLHRREARERRQYALRQQ